MAKTAIEKEIAALIGESRLKVVVELLTKPRDMKDAPRDGSQVLIVFKRLDDRLVRATARYRADRWRVGTDTTGNVIVLPDERIVGWMPLLPHPQGHLE
jgi:hypothetical protein